MAVTTIEAQKHESQLAKSLEPFVCGGAAATFASIIIHPIDLAKVRFFFRFKCIFYGRNPTMGKARKKMIFPPFLQKRIPIGTDLLVVVIISFCFPSSCFKNKTKTNKS